jgi:hypothetical protein
MFNSPGSIQIESLSDDEINNMLSPDVSEKDILKASEEGKVIEKTESTKESVNSLSNKKLEIKDLDAFEEDEEEEIEEKSSEEKAEIPAKKEKKPMSKDVKEEKSSESLDIDYKSAVDYLVQEGLFIDFDGRDTFEFDKNSFGELLKAQVKAQAEDAVSEKINTLGDVAKQLVEFEANNGDPRQILSIFEQERDISAIDIETTEGCEEIIREYYTRAGKSKTWTDKQINFLKEEGDEALRNEATENKTLLLDSVKEELEATQAAQKEYENRRKIAEQQFNQSMKKFIHSDNLPDREKKELEKFYFEYKNTPEGVNNDFRAKFLEIQQDPKKYYKFVKFVKDFDKFENENVTANEVKKATFDFLRRSQGEGTKKTTFAPEFASKTKQKNPFTI